MDILNSKDTIEIPEQKGEEVVVETNPFDLEQDEKELADLIDRKISDSQIFYENTLKLKTRRERNKKYWLGKQIDNDKLHSWTEGYVDNLIYQNLETRISLAVNKIPDIIVTATNNELEKIENAKNLTKALKIKLHRDMSRRVIKRGIRDNHLSFVGVVKCWWDDSVENGDYTFENINPNNIIFDHTATYPEDGFTADRMEYICEYKEEPLSLILSKFPEKKEELLKELAILDKDNQKRPTKLKYQEVWYTWYDESGKVYEAVCWKYKKIILKKMKNPYYDWEGYKEEEKTVYFNHFNKPRKPYIFFTYQNLGDHPIDDTTAVEQSLDLQDSVNKRGRQITTIADRAIPKLAVAGAYLQKDDVESITNDPDEVIWIKGAENINQAIMQIPAQMPSPMLLQMLQNDRSQIDSKFNTHATTRGERVPNESGIARTITREGDLATSDDIVAMVVERVFYEMCNWAVQMMKTQYDETHYIKDTGKDGEMIYLEMSRDTIDDGILVNVKGSTVDKAVLRDNSLTMAQYNQIDPLSLAEDLDLSNPKERTRRLIAFQSQDFQGYSDIAGLGQTVIPSAPETPQPQGNGAEIPPTTPPMEGMPGGVPAVPPVSPEMMGQVAPETPTPSQVQALEDIKMLASGQDVTPPPNVDQPYIQVFIELVQTPEFEQLPQEIQSNIELYVQKLKQLMGVS